MLRFPPPVKLHSIIIIITASICPRSAPSVAPFLPPPPFDFDTATPVFNIVEFKLFSSYKNRGRDPFNEEMSLSLLSVLVVLTASSSMNVELIEKRRGLSPSGRVPPSCIHQVIIITGLNKL